MWIQKRGSKYGNKTTVYGGLKYDSKREAHYAQELELRKKAGEIKEIIPQFRLPLDVNGYHICNYIVDFMVTLSDGEKQLHEVKGWATDIFRLKWKLAEALYGKEYTLILIKV
jgi:hypothetical protein